MIFTQECLMSTSVSGKSLLAGQGAIFAAAFLMSTNGLFIKLLPWHPVTMAGIRSMVAFVFLGILRLVSPPPKGTKNPVFPLLAAAVLFSVTIYLFFIANKLTTSANAIMLQYGAPIWAAILAWFLLKEKPHWEHWAALALVFGGLALIFRDGLGRGALSGNAIAVLSGITFGAHSVFLRMLKNGNPADAMLLTHLICALIGLPFIFLYPPTLTFSSVMSILFMGIFQIGLASLLFAFGLKIISAVEALLIDSIEPVLNPIWVLAITGEKASIAALTGGASIILAVVFSSLIGIRREKKESSA